jgi:RimJ/RimL family protein N-acetyltransferase
MEWKFDDFRLRPFRRSDIPALAFHGHDHEIWGYVRDRFPYPYTQDDAYQWVRWTERFHPPHYFAIEVDGEASGCIGFDRQEDVYSINAELGYWLGRRHWGRGIMSRCLPPVLAYGFETLRWHRVYATVFSNNLASARVLEKNGFRREAELLESVRKKGEIIDQWVYALLARELPVESARQAQTRSPKAESRQK